MNLKDKLGIGYIIFTIILLGIQFIDGYQWVFFIWFTITCLIGIISGIINSYQRDKRLNELEQKFALQETSE